MHTVYHILKMYRFPYFSDKIRIRQVRKSVSYATVVTHMYKFCKSLR